MMGWEAKASFLGKGSVDRCGLGLWELDLWEKRPLKPYLLMLLCKWFA
jgi:hypothetical protein